MKTLTHGVVCLLLIGCGGSEPVADTTQQEYVTVINKDGEQKIVPVEDLIDNNTGVPTVKRVLAIDRETGVQVWVKVDEVRNEPPSNVRFIPVTRTKPNSTRD